MLPDELKTYLDKCRESSLTFTDLLPRLQLSGWTAEQIEIAKKYYDPAQTVRPPETGPVNLPPVVTSAAPLSDEPAAKIKKTRSFPVGILVFLILFFVLVGGVGASSYFIAAGKLVLPDANLQKTVSTFLLKIPFLPKNPKLLLTSSLAAHEKLSRNMFELSIAAASNEFQSTFGAGSFDFQIKGYTDLTVPEDPRFYLTIDATKDFSAEIRKPDKMVYFKVNKVPLLLSAYVGIDPVKLLPILENWVAYDTTGLETEAAKNLPQLNPKSPVDAETEKILTRMAEEDILPLITVTLEDTDGFPAYRLDFKPTPEQLDTIYYKLKDEVSKNPDAAKNDTLTKDTPPSKSMRDFSLSLWLDRSEYYVRKAVITSIVVGSPALLPGSPIALPVIPDKSPEGTPTEISLSFALKLSGFGQQQQVAAPEASITPEEFISLIMQSSSVRENTQPETESLPTP